MRNEWFDLNWSEMRIHTTREAIEPISNILHETGSGGVVIEDPLELSKERDSFFGEIYEIDPNKFPREGVFLKVYFPNDPSLSGKVKDLRKQITNLQSFDIDIGHNEIILESIDEEDWSTAWKAYYKPIQISPKISIVPTWESHERTSDAELVIELDPGMAFGTGAHATTALSIQALEKYLNNEALLIDVGSGSGILSIAAALLGASSVSAYDLDQVAIRSTNANVAFNNASHIVQAQKNNLLDNVHEQADIIVANILAEVIVTFVQEAKDNLKKDGLFITSGIITRKKQMVMDTLLASNFEIIETTEKDGWACIIAKNIL